MFRKNIAATAVAFATLLTNNACAQNLPPWAKWSTQALPHATVLKTFLALKANNDYLAGKDRSFVSFSNWNEGPLQGYWQFSDGDVDMAPKRYFRYVIAPGAQWNIEVSWACDDTPKSCQEFQNAIPSMLPPPPPPPPPPTFDPLQDAILHESCTPKDPSQPIIYPAELVGTGATGRVELLLTLNPCGEVKRAVLVKPSGNPLLDNAAVKNVQGWVISPKRAELSKGRGGIVRVPVVYMEDAQP